LIAFLNGVRYLRAYRACLRNCLARELEFRGHFLLQVGSNLLWAVLSLALATFVFRNVRRIGDWDLDRMVLLTGSFLLVMALTNFLFLANMMALSRLVNRGDLDFVLIKPMSSQFLVSMRYVTFSELPATLVAVGYLLSGVQRLGLRPGPVELLVYLGLVASAVACFYALWFICVTSVLWTGRINNIAFVIMPIMDLGRVPTDVYGGLLRPFFTFVLPIALIATVPTRALLGLLDPVSAVSAPLLAGGLLLLANRFWHFSLRHYSSASS
jgi:viologen exporter family transport system permease protein